MNEMLFKYYPQIMIIIGVILQIWGGTILFHRTQEYRNTANTTRNDIKTLNEKISEKNSTILNLGQTNEKLNKEISQLSETSNTLGEENKELNYQIRNLSTRISEQSKLIENQITGGDSYGDVTLSHIKYENDLIQSFYFKNNGDYPLQDVSIRVRNQKLIKEKLKEKEDGTLSIEDLKDYKTYNLGNIPANSGKTFGGFFKVEEGKEYYYGFAITTKHRSFSQLYKFIKNENQFYTAVYLNTIKEKGEKKFKVLMDKADSGFPNEKNGKIFWEDK